MRTNLSVDHPWRPTTSSPSQLPAYFDYLVLPETQQQLEFKALQLHEKQIFEYVARRDAYTPKDLENQPRTAGALKSESG